MNEFKVIPQVEAIDLMDLIYLESPNGYHFAIDATYLDQIGEFEMKLPTGEVFNSKLINP